MRTDDQLPATAELLRVATNLVHPATDPAAWGCHGDFDKTEEALKRYTAIKMRAIEIIEKSLGLGSP